MADGVDHIDIYADVGEEFNQVEAPGFRHRRGVPSQERGGGGGGGAGLAVRACEGETDRVNRSGARSTEGEEYAAIVDSGTRQAAPEFPAGWLQ